MSKYVRFLEELKNKGTARRTVFGQSMTPIIKSGSLLTFEKKENYHVDEIVFCKVHGRYIDAHKIIKKDAARGYLIANNKGHENGWTWKVFGKVVNIEIK